MRGLLSWNFLAASVFWKLPDKHTEVIARLDGHLTCPRLSRPQNADHKATHPIVCLFFNNCNIRNPALRPYFGKVPTGTIASKATSFELATLCPGEEPRQAQRVQVPVQYIHRPRSHDRVAFLRPKYIPYTKYHIQVLYTIYYIIYYTILVHRPFGKEAKQIREFLVPAEIENALHDGRLNIWLGRGPGTQSFQKSLVKEYALNHIGIPNLI